ncbi:MAG: helix-turn-helix domain-containing protein [Candidatus Binatia bacterium]
MIGNPNLPLEPATGDVDMSAPLLRHQPLFAIRPPYAALEALPLEKIRAAEWGEALVMQVRDVNIPSAIRTALARRKRETPLYVILPPPNIFRSAPDLPQEILSLKPEGIYPHMAEIWPEVVKYSMSLPPAEPALDACQYIRESGVPMPSRVFDTVVEIFEVADSIKTVNRLSRHLCVSRRTLGRLFRTYELPQPSHWLQFSRVFRVCLRMHSNQETVTRSAMWGGYPDAFTFSNQMNRLLGIRPSLAKSRLGWKWLIEAWLVREVETARYVDPCNKQRVIAISKRAIPESAILPEGVAHASAKWKTPCRWCGRTIPLV